MSIKEFIEYLESSNFSLAVENERLVLRGDKKKLSKEQIQSMQGNTSVINFIQENKEELIRYISVSAAAHPGKKSRDISSMYGLTGLQQGMLFHSLYDANSRAYIDQFSCELTGLDPDYFVKSWEYLLQKHTVLRTAFIYDAFKIPVQCVYEKVSNPVELLDYRHLSQEEQRTAIENYKQVNSKEPFDFKHPPLMRVGLIRLDNDRFTMVWSYHHILFDGWSLPVLMEEFLTTYELLKSGQGTNSVSEDRFEDFIRYTERINKKKEEEYWKKYMTGLEQGTLLPFIPPVADRNKGIGVYNTLMMRIGAESAQKIQTFAQKNRVTVNTLMQGVWSILLHKYSGNSNVVFGTIVSGRPDDLPGVERRVGLFINTLPLHSKRPDGPLVEWLQDLQQEQVSSRQFQHTSLQTIQSWTGVKGDLFDTILVFENYPVSKIVQSRKWSIEIADIHTWEQTNYPLTLTIGSGEQISVRFRYNTRLLSDEYVQHIHDHFEHVLFQLVEGKAGRLSDIQLLTALERARLLTGINQSTVTYPSDKTVVELLEWNALNNPDKPAIVFEKQTLSYREFNERSNQLANLLRSRGIKQEALIPVLMERSIEMLVGVMGILKAGAAYVPIDPDYPLERVQYILDDTKATVVVSNNNCKNKIANVSGIQVVCLDNSWSEISSLSSDNPGLAQPGQLAYVIYTSGSTGKPKGVMIEHRALMDHCYGVIESAGLEKCSSFAIFAPLVFDAGHSMFHSAFILGATTFVLSNRMLTDGDQLSEYISSNEIDCVKIVPSLWLTYADTGNLILAQKVMIFGGEGFAPDIIDRLVQADYKGDVFNHYGPTEATIGKTIHKVNLKRQYQGIPIGKPFSNTQLYIVDSLLHPVPVGVSGELMIAGDGLARGYLNLPQLTEEKFIRNPFTSNPDAKMYRTGDQVRWLPDGDIEYLGRIDEQVKIRGFRIETSEIEGAILQSQLVNQAVVVAKQDAIKNKRLVAYVIPKPEFNKELAVSFLRTKIPDYMIPVLWVSIENLPLTINGKVDKKALPDPDASELLSDQYVEPRTEIESRLAAIWKDVLGVERVGVRDNFFDLGGHSLLVMRVISAIRKELQVELAIATFFELLTIEELANYIKVNQVYSEKKLEKYDTIKL